MSPAGSPRVTVVMPSYESATTVRAAVDSVLAQTFADFELLVVDDGSVREPVPTDLPEDPRIQVIRRERNGGYARVTNEATERARGEWVTFVDADDVIAPRYLERLVAAGESAGAQAVFTPMVRVVASAEGGSGRALGTGPWDPPAPVIEHRVALEALLTGRLSGTQHLLLRRPEPVAELDQVYSDFVYVVRNVARGGTVACVDEELYLNTVHPASATGSLRPGVWDLVRLNALVAPEVRREFGAAEAERLLQAHRDLTLTQILHTAACEREATPLRDQVTAWCRDRVTARGVLRQLRRRRLMDAGSWSLVKLSPALHRRAYQAFDARRKQTP